MTKEELQELKDDINAEIAHKMSNTFSDDAIDALEEMLETVNWHITRHLDSQ